MNDLHDDVLEQRLRVACREMIPLLAHDGTAADGGRLPLNYTVPVDG